MANEREELERINEMLISVLSDAKVDPKEFIIGAPFAIAQSSLSLSDREFSVTMGAIQKMSRVWRKVLQLDAKRNAKQETEQGLDESSDEI